MEWSPCEVLKIVDLSTCAGFAATKGRRCGNRLSASKIETAEALLDEMSFHPTSDEAGTMELMESLASHLLCTQWHEEQAPRLLEQWRIRMLNSRKAEVTQKIQESSKELEDITSRLERASLAGPRRDRTATGISVTLPREPSSAPENATPLFRVSGITFGCIDEFQNPHPDLRSSPTHYQNHHQHQREQKAATSSKDRILSHQSSAYETESQGHVHDTSKDCPICLEATKEDRHGVTRCPGCLEVFHESCVDLWTEECKTNGGVLTCPNCRLDWRD